jgi:hypothetical protein
VHVYNVRYFQYSFQTSLVVGYVVIEFDNLDECRWRENLQGNASLDSRDFEVTEDKAGKVY